MTGAVNPQTHIAAEPISGGTKAVPGDPRVRARIRSEAGRVACGIGRSRPPRRKDLEDLAAKLLVEAGLSESLRGFAMVAIDNAFWQDQFARVPFQNRLLLLPRCLRCEDACPAAMTVDGLACEACGRCGIGALKRDAEALGYTVIVAEGTPAVVQTVLSGRCDAVLGVACLDSL